MPIEVRRFGVGHRRPDGPPGTVGIEGQVIQSGATGVVAELAFGRRARITPHSNPNTTYLLVIEGGGWVGVGDERTRIQAGEAAVWPPDVLHSAWTDGAPMRAIVVELPEPPPELAAVFEGAVSSVPGFGAEPVPVRAPRVAPDRAPGGPGAPGGAGAAADRAPAPRAEGRLAPRPPIPGHRGGHPGTDEGEPL